MNKNLIIGGVIALLVVVIGFQYFSGGVGGTSNFNDLSVDTIAVSGASTMTGDTTVSGGTFTVTTANTATSTIVVGCIQTYATSTVTPIRYQASTTPGIMYSAYGTCPNL